mmetsp:Transcript_21131/g.60111  ORF Transcript_21131/g.60111 Transcript_21131/m.60111 type:complete len:218 (-) Transcript_21131:1020-1673(-)
MHIMRALNCKHQVITIGQERDSVVAKLVQSIARKLFKKTLGKLFQIGRERIFEILNYPEECCDVVHSLATNASSTVLVDINQFLELLHLLELDRHQLLANLLTRLVKLIARTCQSLWRCSVVCCCIGVTGVTRTDIFVACFGHLANKRLKLFALLLKRLCQHDARTLVLAGDFANCLLQAVIFVLEFLRQAETSVDREFCLVPVLALVAVVDGVKSW